MSPHSFSQFQNPVVTFLATEAELMREHADLSAMVGFMGEYVREHFHADWPRGRPPCFHSLKPTGSVIPGAD
jgi:hypothetical protein